MKSKANEHSYCKEERLRRRRERERRARAVETAEEREIRNLINKHQYSLALAPKCFNILLVIIINYPSLSPSLSQDLALLLKTV